MKFFDLVNISEQFMELVNPTSPEKILRLGQYLNLQEGSRVIDFGCGFAEPLVIWAENFGITGIGLDIREYACARAQQKITERGLEDRLQIICEDAATYPFQPGAFDVAACLGATFIWENFQGAVQAMQRAVVPGGRLAIGEPYWLHDNVPAAYAQRQNSFHLESDLLQISREAGFLFEAIIRASHEDWDRYETDNWRGLIHWLRENPGHPERHEVSKHLENIQNEYLQYGRQHLGWALYTLAPLP